MPPSYITVLASFIKDRPKLVMDKVQTLVDLIAETTDISANYIPSMYPTFMDTNLVQFNWHQDTDTAFKYQDLYNSINVWIPIVKTNADQCGLHLLPFDVLKQLNSSLWERMVGTGASCVVPNGQNTHVWFQEDNQQMPLGFDITDYAVTPSVLPGDAIILRGDVCHASQVGESRRVALSFRCFNPRGVIYRDRFFAGSEVKKKFIAGNPIYNKVIRAFESAATVSCIEV
jgi:ectoine hydroxylase-related dioxygenase (phytanoyl-CoA dioxygenase family)